MRRTAIVGALAWTLGCGGGTPSQAAGPRPNLDDPPAGSASTSVASSTDAADALAALERKDCKAASDAAQTLLGKNAKHALAHYILGVCADPTSGIARPSDANVEQAVAHYRAALASNGKLTEASINLSALLYDQKRFDEAAAVARDGLKLDRGAIELHLNLAWALFGLGDAERSKKAFANARELSRQAKDSIPIRMQCGLGMLRLGDADAALEDFGAVAKQSGKAPREVLLVVAEEQRQDGYPQACIDVLARASDAASLAYRALCKLQVGDLAGANADGEASLKQQPSAIAHRVLGLVAQKKKDATACKTHFRAALALLEPKDRAYEETKAKLESCK